jgi:hypothetical protein
LPIEGRVYTVKGAWVEIAGGEHAPVATQRNTYPFIDVVTAEIPSAGVVTPL